MLIQLYFRAWAQEEQVQHSLKKIMSSCLEESLLLYNISDSTSNIFKIPPQLSDLAVGSQFCSPFVSMAVKPSPILLGGGKGGDGEGFSLSVVFRFWSRGRAP